MIKNKKGFTLAETLITLTILGVIAAISIPSLVNNVKQRIYISRWKKAYAEISQVMDMLMLEYPEAKSFQNIVTRVKTETGLATAPATAEILKSHFIALFGVYTIPDSPVVASFTFNLLLHIETYSFVL